MNIQEADVLRVLLTAPFENQRALAKKTGHSLGMVNRSLKNLQSEEYLTAGLEPTEKARREAAEKRPRNAVLLAAGFGMRMVPINTETPKGLLEVRGERLAERLIRQLRDAGVSDIVMVVGFMKERYEYLIDRYGVRLICNPDYASKNNLHSLCLAESLLGNTYVVPCDLWCPENPFRETELYSWYMVSPAPNRDSPVRVNRRLELVRAEAEGCTMTGISYLLETEAQLLRQKLREMDRDPRHDSAFWEEALWQGKTMLTSARTVEGVVEINTYEQLRDLDSGSSQLQSNAIETAARVFETAPSEIRDIQVLKKGMTNRSFLFSCGSERYIMRIPGEGTGQLIDRGQEAAVYHALEGTGLGDDVRYLSPDSGYKITKYWENSRVCDPGDPRDVRRCMEVLRRFHEKKLQVDHRFDLFEKIELYERLWKGAPSVYEDYGEVKARVLSLRPYIEAHRGEPCLSHIDAVPDNFLFVEQDGREEIRLIDWEYAGMQDPHVDLAMFSVYSYYDRAQVDRLVDFYFAEGCPWETRIKIYCYVSVCGLLWSNWCEYKRSLGVDFGAYSLFQYRAAKEFYRIAREEMKKETNNNVYCQTGSDYGGGQGRPDAARDPDHAQAPGGGPGGADDRHGDPGPAGKRDL